MKTDSGFLDSVLVILFMCMLLVWFNQGCRTFLDTVKQSGGSVTIR